jgi:16S rRNA G966 N2-methylase RsmD
LVKSVPRHNTQAEIAKEASVSQGTISRAEQVRKKAPELWEKAKAGDLTIGAAYNQVRKEDRRQEKRERIAAVEQANLIEANDKITVQLGDVWQLGRHTLYCGDTTTDDFRKILTISDFAFADPPYGAGVDEWDNAFVWDHDYLLDYAPIVAVTPGIVSIAELMRRTTMPYRWSTATWITNGMTRGALGFGNWIYTAIFANPETSLHRNAQDHHRITISTTETDDSAHRGRKPSAYMAEILGTFTEEGNTIIDCFLGSGTTLLAAEKLNRTCVGGELNPEYCANIISRWQALTGQKAVRL